MRNPFKQQPHQRTNAEIVGDHLFSFERACETAGITNPQFSPEEVEAEQAYLADLRAKFKAYRDQEATNGR